MNGLGKDYDTSVILSKVSTNDLLYPFTRVCECVCVCCETLIHIPLLKVVIKS